jgi:hypothetical protein
MSSSNGLLVVTAKLKYKEIFRTAAMLLFYILQKLSHQKLHIFQYYIIIHNFRTLILIGASVAPTSQVRASTMLLLLIVGN